jgi:hypothetical protein
VSSAGRGIDAGVAPRFALGSLLMPSQFGGTDDLLSVELKVPLNLRLRIDGDRVKKAAGNRVATLLRKRIRSGQDGDGTPLPTPQQGGRPLNRTGDLIRSIRYDPFRSVVRPIGKREDLGASLRGRRQALMAVLIHTRKIEPMRVDEKIDAGLVEAAQKEIDRQLTNGGAGLIGELRRIRA